MISQILTAIDISSLVGAQVSQVLELLKNLRLKAGF